MTIKFEQDDTRDDVNAPAHYTWLKDKAGVEPIDICRHLDFDLGNAVKYILRAGRKHEAGMDDRDKTIQDLQKAIYYLNDHIKHYEDKDSGGTEPSGQAVAQ